MPFRSHDSINPDQTRQLGCKLGKMLKGGEVLAITGELGSGKTQLVQGIAQGLGIAPSEITSPTFTLIHEHEGRLPLYHIDLYRLETPHDIESLGLEEYFTRNAVVAIEWAERATSLLPPDRVQIILSHQDNGTRRVIISEREKT